MRRNTLPTTVLLCTTSSQSYMSFSPSGTFILASAVALISISASFAITCPVRTRTQLVHPLFWHETTPPCQAVDPGGRKQPVFGFWSWSSHRCHPQSLEKGPSRTTEVSTSGNYQFAGVCPDLAAATSARNHFYH